MVKAKRKLTGCDTVTACPSRFARVHTLRLRKVSDTGLLEVARRCSALTALDLSRSELPFKVGDITLLVSTDLLPASVTAVDDSQLDVLSSLL